MQPYSLLFDFQFLPDDKDNKPKHLLNLPHARLDNLIRVLHYSFLIDEHEQLTKLEFGFLKYMVFLHLIFEFMSIPKEKLP